jgi:transcriptional regulator GlxA family with amidase domain
VQAAMLYIEEHCSAVLSLDNVAKSLNLSGSRLRHLFKDDIGLPPTKYLKRLRMQRAKDLLTSTFLSVKEINTKVGGTDLSHFVRNFKTAYGMSPLRYRLSMLKRNHGRLVAGFAAARTVSSCASAPNRRAENTSRR